MVPGGLEVAGSSQRPMSSSKPIRADGRHTVEESSYHSVYLLTQSYAHLFHEVMREGVRSCRHEIRSLLYDFGVSICSWNKSRELQPQLAGLCIARNTYKYLKVSNACSMQQRELQALPLIAHHGHSFDPHMISVIKILSASRATWS